MKLVRFLMKLNNETVSMELKNGTVHGTITDYYYFRWRPQLGTKYTQLQIVNALRLGERERAFKMLLSLGNANGSLGPDDFTVVLDYCAKTPDPLMHDLGLEPSGDTYDGFVKAVVYGKGVAYGMEVIESMEKRNIKPYNDTLAALSTDHSKNLELDLAEDLLEKISDGLPKYINSFNAILAACDVMDLQVRMKIGSDCEYESLYYLDDGTLYSGLDGISSSDTPLQWHYRISLTVLSVYCLR